MYSAAVPETEHASTSFGVRTNSVPFDLQGVLTPNGNRLARLFGGEGSSPPTAGQWADPDYDISGWGVVSSPEAGDVVARARQYSGGATGHVAIMISGIQSIGANATVVHVTDFGYGQSHLRNNERYIYRRYVGN